MDELPELPFEKVLSYLSLQDRLRLGAVSRSCHLKVANSRVKILCYSKHPRDFILGKSRWVSELFAQNFISSTRFASFFDTFTSTILSTLKHLHLCDLDLSEADGTAFTRILNSFGQLEELAIVRVQCGQHQESKLNLPMLTSIHLEDLSKKVILEAPRLREAKLEYYLRVEIVHGESVERLFTKSLKLVTVKNMKNLQYLHVFRFQTLDSTLLSHLEQLKEIHINFPEDVSDLFEQKRRYDRADLKIYRRGLLLNGPEDLEMDALRRPKYLPPEAFVHFPENPSRLADVIAFEGIFFYWPIDALAPQLEADLLKRFTDLKHIIVHHSVQDVQRFLYLLKNLENIVELGINIYIQPQDLIDRLPEHCTVQKLTIFCSSNSPDFRFLFRLKHLIHLTVYCSIDIETVSTGF